MPNVIGRVIRLCLSLKVIPVFTTPYAQDDTWFERTYYIHRFIGVDNTTVVCPKATLGRPCPICDYRNSLDKNDPEELKQINSLYPKERQLFNVVVYEGGVQSEVMVLDQPRSGLGKIVDGMVAEADQEDDYYQYYADLDEGSTLKLNIDELNAGTFKYFGVTSVEFKERKKAYPVRYLSRSYRWLYSVKDENHFALDLLAVALSH